MENTTNDPLQNSSDSEQHKKDIQTELNALLAHQVEDSTPPSLPVVPPAPVVEESTPAFSGMRMSEPHVDTPVPVVPVYVPTYKPVEPHVSKVEFSPDAFDSKRTFAPIVQKSSHAILWTIIFLTIVFLAVLGGAAYWYLKVYSPQNMIEDTASTTTSVKTNSSVPMVFTPPVRSKDSLFKATTSTAVKIKSPVVKVYTLSDKDKVIAYIKSHINSLSPRKSSVGFAVSDITFDGPDRAVVDYGNSKATYTAVAVSYIDSKGNVKVTSFTILEK
jgi:hypothetical protein